MKILIQITTFLSLIFLRVINHSFGQIIRPTPNDNYLLREQNAPQSIKNRLAELRAQKILNKWTFDPAYTNRMDIELSTVTGAIPPANFRQHVITQNARAKIVLDRLKLTAPNRFNGNIKGKSTAVSYTAGASHFDWRDQNVLTPVEDQKCNAETCWDFAACSAFEESWKLFNNQIIDVSEQNILDCNNQGKGCGGGWPSDAFDYITDIGVAKEGDYPYIARRVTPCNQALSKPYKAENWGYVGDGDEIPDVNKIKQALEFYGPIVVGINATLAFQAFASRPGEVFNENASGIINHVVTVIRWDDYTQAWLIKIHEAQVG